MEDLLMSLVGKRLDLICGSAQAIRGEVIGISDGVVSIRDEEGRTGFVKLERISAVFEVKESGSRPGFLG